MTKSNLRPDVWGVIGGMGPLASAEFVNTIYEQSTINAEQEFPIVFLASDPTIPDRTQAVLDHNEEALIRQFSTHVQQLISVGVTKIIVCCITIHSLIPRLPANHQEKIISLVDVILENVLQSDRTHLLICSEGTRKTGLFEKHKLWRHAKKQIILPKEDDQNKIHALIYEIKRNRRNIQHIESLQSLLGRYQVSSYIAGCTEIHILAKEQEKNTGIDRRMFCIDPLTIVASNIASSVTSS
jgi:aspartate racemase